MVNNIKCSASGLCHPTGRRQCWWAMKVRPAQVRLVGTACWIGTWEWFFLLRDFTANHSLSITNTVFEHKRAHKCTWHYIVGCRSVIHFVIISSDLRQYVLDIQSKRGAELSTDLVVSWIRWIRYHLVRVCWEDRAEVPVWEIFNSHLQLSFDSILSPNGPCSEPPFLKLCPQGCWCMLWW